MITQTQARRIVRDELERRGLAFSRLTSRTVDFTDLARARPIFVTIHGWKGDPASSALQRIAREHGFRVEFRMGRRRQLSAERFTLRIELGNAAMESGEHLADALRKVADRLEPEPSLHPSDEVRIRDVNGNTIGGWRLE